MRIGTVLIVGLALIVGVSRAFAQGPPPPPNDNRAAATVLGSLPADVTGTTVGATTEENEPYSSCAATGPSVWYQISVGDTAPDRIAVRLQASGDLDAIVDVYVKQRSQNVPVRCDATDKHGEAALAFKPVKATTYLIRVANVYNSASAAFSLSVFALPPPARPPGSALPSGGAGGTLERVLNSSAAYSSLLAPGTTYRINLVNRTDGCMRLDAFAPGTSSFDGATPLFTLPCAGYRLFTPRVGGRYSFLVEGSDSVSGPQRYYLDLAGATPADSAPGVFIRNYARVKGFLRGNRIDVVRLYRFDVVDRSNLDLELAPSSPDSPFSLELRDDRGRMIECACDSTGSASITRTMSPGRYFIAVRARDFASGGFTLIRRSRTITRTVALIDGTRFVQVTPGMPLALTAALSPSVDGPVTLEVQRFDPLSGWQYVTTLRLRSVAGTAGASYTPPAPGRWRVVAAFTGTRTASPSESGFAQALVAGPLTE
jgi:hypothetical protein